METIKEQVIGSAHYYNLTHWEIYMETSSINNIYTKLCGAAEVDIRALISSSYFVMFLQIVHIYMCWLQFKFRGQIFPFLWSILCISNAVSQIQ